MDLINLGSENYGIKNFLSLFLFAFITMIFSKCYASENMVVPGGQSIGVTLSYGGVYIDDFGDISTLDGEKHSPAKEAGLKKGDIIKKIDGEEIKTVDDMTKILALCSAGDTVELYVLSSDGSEKKIKSSVEKDSSDEKIKLGVWAKDAASGVGTITYFEPSTKSFAAVGHEISGMMNEKKESRMIGDIYRCDIVGVRKGERGTPGELIGVYSENKRRIGEVAESSHSGLSGFITDFDNCIFGGEKMYTASSDEVHEGDAYILSNVEGEKVEKFSIIIEKIDKDNDCDKNIIFKINDDALLKKTGGIVRGMSGSPIIQDGKLIGAVTHVCVNL